MSSQSDSPQLADPSSRFDLSIVNALKKLLGKHPRTLLVYHDIGTQLKRIGESFGRGTNWRKKLAEELGVSDSTLGKCLQFRQRFEAEDIPHLQHLEIPWAHLAISFGIRNKQKRLRLLAKAKTHGWGERELRREIQHVNGTCRGCGRKCKQPKSGGQLADVNELARLSEGWNRFYIEVCARSLEDVGDIDRPVGAKALRKQLQHARLRVQALRRAAGEALRSIISLAAELPEE